MAKSETYQKEGWSVLEDENKVFGPSTENNDDLQDEIWFSKSNIETKKAKLDKSAKDFTEFVTEYISDVEDIPQEDVDRGVAEILKKAFPADTQSETKATKKTSKITLKVLFIAALLSAIVFSTICVVGKSNNISIENGFVTFAKDAVHIAFFGNEEEQYISVESLLLSLEEHGYDDILFPEEIIAKSNKYNVTIPVYKTDVVDDVTFDIYDDTRRYSFLIYKNTKQRDKELINLENAQTVNTNGTNIYLFEFENNLSIEFIDEFYQYYIVSDLTYSEAVIFAESIKNVNEIK